MRYSTGFIYRPSRGNAARSLCIDLRCRRFINIALGKLTSIYNACADDADLNKTDSKSNTR